MTAVLNGRNELFASDHPPAPAEQGAVVNIPIDTWTGLRANQFCQDNIQVGTFVNLFPTDPWALQMDGGRRPAGRATYGPADPTAIAPGWSLRREHAAADGSHCQPGRKHDRDRERPDLPARSQPQNFDRYQIEIAPANTNTFNIVAGPFQTQQPTLGTVLADWDSRGVSNGQYILRLSMFASAASGGGFLNRDVRIIVQNVQPTATPIPTQVIVPTSTTLPFPEATTIPFQGQTFGQPTATATITVGG